MVGYLNFEGHLSIKRRGVLWPQLCPGHYSNYNCGDWCPHFGEPQRPKTKGLYIKLEICHRKVLSFETLIDERKEESDA
jgi:hypothetical protein